MAAGVHLPRRRQCGLRGFRSDTVVHIAFIYSEEGNVDYGVATKSAFRPFKAQTRLWGYNLNHQQEEQTLSSVLVEGSKIKDQAQASNGYSPLQAKRAWNRLAKDNVAAKMERTGLM